MSRRLGRHILVVVLGLVPISGCQSWPLGGSSSLPSGSAANAHARSELPPGDTAEICLALAASMEKSGSEGEAIGQYEKARQLNPSLQQVARHLAVLYDRQGQYTRAVAEYQLAIKLQPKDSDLFNDFGYCHYNHGKWSEAEKYLTEAITLNADNKRAWINLGMTLAQQERYPESLEAFHKALPGAQAHCNIAFIMTTQGKQEEAKKEYRLALAEQADLSLARAALAKLENAKNPVVPAAAPNPPAAVLTAPKPAAPPVEAPTPVTSLPSAPKGNLQLWWPEEGEK